MNLRKISLYLCCLIIGFISCSKDKVDVAPEVKIEDRNEQQAKDMDSLNKYLNVHYYNASDINALLPNAKLSDIIIIKVEAGGTVPTGYTKLKDAVGAAKKTTFAETEYEYYVLDLNTGGGINAPMFSDKIRVTYEGFKLDDAVFDASILPIDLDFIGNGSTTSGTITGWRKVIPSFKIAESFVENADGTISFLNHGLGIMFLPSGLAYFSNPTVNIPAYSPIIFKFELLQMFENDHDGDGIPSYLEDLNNDGEYNINFTNLLDDTDDDTDGNRLPDYLDADDDGDGKLTKDEIVISKVTETTLEAVKNTPLLSNQVLLNKIDKNKNGTFTGTIITFTDTVVGKPYDYLDKTVK